MGSLDQAVNNRQQISSIKHRYVTGEISREEAKLLAQPIIDQINLATVRKTGELNKKYGLKRKPALLNFVNAMRNEY
jgi:hypothetical protein